MHLYYHADRFLFCPGLFCPVYPSHLINITCCLPVSLWVHPLSAAWSSWQISTVQERSTRWWGRWWAAGTWTWTWPKGSWWPLSVRQTAEETSGGGWSTREVGTIFPLDNWLNVFSKNLVWFCSRFDSIFVASVKFLAVLWCFPVDVVLVQLEFTLLEWIYYLLSYLFFLSGEICFLQTQL